MTHSLLQQPTLVLNRNWQAIHITPVQRALVLICNGSARAVDPGSYQVYGWTEWVLRGVEPTAPAIRSARCRIAAPEVIVLTAYDRLPSASVSFSKRNVLRRDHFTCQYCGVQPGLQDLSIDHVKPRAQGGATTWENCVSACLNCNHRKADRTPEQVGMRLRRLPVRPQWQPIYSRLHSGRSSWQPFLPSRPTD